MAAPFFILETSSSDTNLGALAPGISTPPISKSQFLTSSAIVSGVDIDVLTSSLK